MRWNRWFRVPSIIYPMLNRKNMHNYITYEVLTKSQKTRTRSPAPFSVYTFENSGCRWVVWEIDTDVTLNFYTHAIYICTNAYLQFQASRTHISCPVASESGER